MKVTGNIKGRWRNFSLHNSTAMSHAKGGEVTRERNVTCRGCQDTKRQQESQDLQGSKRGNPRIFKIAKKEILWKPKT